MFKFLNREKVIKEKTYTKEEYDYLLSVNSNLQTVHNNLKAQIDGIRSTCDVIISERDKLKTLVREQTEADLFINALVGVGVIPKKTNVDVFEDRNRLSSLQSQAASMNTSYSSGYASMLQGSGLFGNPFF